MLSEETEINYTVPDAALPDEVEVVEAPPPKRFGRNVVSAADTMKKLDRDILTMQAKHKMKQNELQNKINTADKQIELLKNKLEMQAIRQNAEIEEVRNSIIDKGQKDKAMQVADMTTFLAQLLFKLTQMSSGFANVYVSS